MKVTDIFAESQTLSPVTVNGKQVDIDSIELDGVNPRDYPDFADAYINNAAFVDGTPLSDSELEQLQDENPDLVYELTIRHVF